ncbi:MAG: hypothetical protein JXR40_03825 [Pontiellaceae bacterium]|nr:hypothetical protein [Pontiellaceae bacterium]
MHTSHTQNQIDKFTGRVALDLPRSFHLGLVDLCNRELRGLPARTGAEVKENIVASVALMMKASNTAAIYEKEAARREFDRETEAAARRHADLESARARQLEAVHAFEAVVYGPRSTSKTVEAAFGTLCMEVSADAGAILLIEWAQNLMNKRKAVRK